ncbi:gamma-butyrobetaine dioxygenase [Aureococcus anophagefferens]|nr:gamma-butyrobetaine dioxygenase [Aureococcus anophagefferens]
MPPLAAVAIAAPPVAVGDPRRVVAATIRMNRVAVTFGDGAAADFHVAWLYDNAPRCFEPASGQRLLYVDTVPLAPPRRAAAAGGDLEIVRPCGAVDVLAGAFLRWDRVKHDDAALGAMCELARARVPRRTRAFETVGAPQVLAHGFVVVSGMPNVDGAVADLARRVGPLSHTEIYGDTFRVESQRDARNALAEDLRAVAPDAFAALARIPATFRKMRPAARAQAGVANAAAVEYRRAHVQTNAEGDVTGVFWAPPFMGPLDADVDDADAYYRAARLFALLMDEGGPADGDDADAARARGHSVGRKVHFKLKPGDAVFFNQRRMLHAREGFDLGRVDPTATTPARLLEGCYVNIDSFLSRTLILRGADDPAGATRVGNQAA